MHQDADRCYEALLTHDSRFDGVFFTGVSTTRIYCRPVCTAKMPKRSSCSFHPSAAAAEREGFRPCLRCRPELAPGSAPIDATGRLASIAASRIEDGALATGSIKSLAADLGVSERHLHRAIDREFGVSPIELAKTHRLLTAKRLLADTALPITEVAFASGFASVRRFNASFKEAYRANPTDFRKAHESPTQPPTLICEVAYRPPLDWEALLGFLAAHATVGVELIEGGRYMRVVECGQHRGWLAVEPVGDRPALRVELATSLAPVLVPTLARVKRLFDLSADPLKIAAHLCPLASAHPGLRVPGAFDGFELAVRAILGQQVSVKGATTVAGRFAAAFGEPVATGIEGLDRLPPSAHRVAEAGSLAIAAIGMPAARGRALHGLAMAVVEGRVSLEPGPRVEEAIAALEALPGIGPWTANYIAMRALGWPDAFPHADLGIAKALNETDPRRVLARAEAWRPWRSYAAMQLWNNLKENP
jgi:AraC family transcriptional regulator of adaptative response / DNA-3-methyladenine glycosylase II